MLIELKIPAVGESVSEVEIGDWLKHEGDFVHKDENLVVLESEKATVELPAPVSGTLTRILKRTSEPAKIGESVAELESEETQPKPPIAQPKDTSPPPQVKADAEGSAGHVMPAAARLMAEKGIQASDVTATGPGGRILKEDVQKVVAPAPAAAASQPPPQTPAQDSTAEQVVRMSKLRRTIAQRLVEAQRDAALLTTFNEIDMTSVMNLRKQFGDAFQKRYGVKLGFMSFFVKAVIDALKHIPELNAEIRGENVIYNQHFDIGIAVGTERGLVVPVLRDAAHLSFAETEKAIGNFALRARDNKLMPDELQGGTFTITNGGIYGSLLSTPIINPPQSGVLGMHAIQDRPVALNGQVVIRPMMYVALTYDHRIVDGREAVGFLKRIKETIESPSRMLLEV